MAINRTGFQATNAGVTIDKDPSAQLTYTLDWTNWLETGDQLATQSFSAAARRNDPTPIVVESSGLTDSNRKSYVELSGGQANKTYIITCTVTTDDGLTDRRAFRINCVNRQA